MPKSIKLLPFLLVALAVSSRASIYVEPRAAILHLSGQPDFGVMVNREVSLSNPTTAAGLALGFEITDRVCLEVRYTDLGRSRADILSTQILPPPTGVPLVALHEYEYSNRRNLWSAALPIRLWSRDGLSLHVTPIAQWEEARTDLVRVDQFASIPEVPTPPTVRTNVRKERSSSLHPAAELSLRYELGARARIGVFHTYAPLGSQDAQLTGVSLAVRF